MMRTGDLLYLSTRMFRTRPLRTFLTVLGVGVGIAAVLFLVSLGYGLQRIILSQITTADSLLALDVTSGNAEVLQLTTERINGIAGQPNVIEVSRMKSISSQFTMDQLTGDGVVYAIDPSYFRLGGLVADHGTLFTASSERSVVVSTAVAKLFNLSDDEILGKELSLTLFIPYTSDQGIEEIEVAAQPEPFTIKGVIADDATTFIYLPLQLISTTGIETYDMLKVKVDSQTSIDPVRDTIIQQGFLVSSLSDIIDQANKIFNVIQIVLGLFGLIALIVSAIGMFNTMTITLLERTNEIGIMRSIGVARRDVRALFMIESVIMGFLGGLGGLTMGLVASELANVGINVLAQNFGGRQLDLFFAPLWFIGIILSFSAIIGFLTGIFPSIRAGKMDPLEALRYK